MIAVIQRVARASVKVDGSSISEIQRGLLILLGVEKSDTDTDSRLLARKTIDMRIFQDSNGKMNLSSSDVEADFLVVSQFTLMADCRKGRRPNFIHAAGAVPGKRLYEDYVVELQKSGLKVKTGVFGAMMHVELINDGPVTIILDSKEIVYKRPDELTI